MPFVRLLQGRWGKLPHRFVGANFGHLSQSLRKRIEDRFDGNRTFFCLLVKVWSLWGDQTFTSSSKARRICGDLKTLINSRIDRRFLKLRSDNIKNTEEKAEITEVSAVDSDVKKQRFGLKIFPETLEIVDTLFEHDNCKSRSEFIEKAIRFYCGYLLNKESTATEFIAPQLASITEGIVKGSEQKLSRSLFKLAVEVGALTHMVAAINEIDDDTLQKLRIMCVDEVKRINGIINFEKAVRYQRSDE